MSSRREVLDIMRAAPDTHPGLWLDRFPEKVEDRGIGKQNHFQELFDRVRVPEGYSRFFERWRAALEELESFTLTAKAEAQGRMVVGLGAESVLETSVALQHTYGVPYIPGSALKGLAAATAHRWLERENWSKGGKNLEIGPAYREMFGDKSISGCVTFHDALWMPTGELLPLDLDVMTIHHADYYGGKDAPPADWDSPKPVVFLTAHGTYWLAVTGPEEWANAAMKILSEALARDGVGAKTAAGYGRMKSDFQAEIGERASGPRSTNPASFDWRQKALLVTIPNAAQTVIPLLDALTGQEMKLAAQAIIEHLGRKALKEKTRRDKNWVRRLFETETGTETVS